MNQFEETGQVEFDSETKKSYREGFLSISVNDKETISTIKSLYEKEKYLLDPHGAVAISAANKLKEKLSDNPLICLATAHPAKFPNIIEKISKNKSLPKAATHKSIEKAKILNQKGYTFNYKNLYDALKSTMEKNWELNHLKQSS